MRQDEDLSSLGQITDLMNLDSTPPPVEFNFAQIAAPPTSSYTPNQRVEESAKHYWGYDMGGPS